MKRRTAILGLGGLVASGGLAAGTGAFTSVEADRNMSVEVVDDTDAYLSPEPLNEDGEPATSGPQPNAQEQPYARVDEDTGRLTLIFDSLNPDAETIVRKVFQVSNEGTQEVGVFFGKEGEETSAVEFYDQDGNRLDVDENNAVRVGTGERIKVDIEFNTHGISSGTDVLDTLILKADSEGGSS